MAELSDYESRPNPTWFGWRRANPRGKWVRVVAAFNEDDCWKLLLNEPPFGGETIVLQVGRDPNTERRAK